MTNFPSKNTQVKVAKEMEKLVKEMEKLVKEMLKAEAGEGWKGFRFGVVVVLLERVIVGVFLVTFLLGGGLIFF